MIHIKSRSREAARNGGNYSSDNRISDLHNEVWLEMTANHFHYGTELIKTTQNSFCQKKSVFFSVLFISENFEAFNY